MFAIYVDASHKIGLGHLNRCLRLSKEISRSKKKIIILTQSVKVKKLFETKNVQILNINRLSKQKIFKYLDKKKVKVIIFDIVKKNYLINSLASNKENTLFKVLIADDNVKLIKTNLTFFPFIGNKKYSKYEYGGKKYCVLEKMPIKKKVKKIKSVLISMGGSDPKNLSLLVAKKLINLNCELNIVLGKLSKLQIKDFDFLKNRELKHKVYKHQDTLKDLMYFNDLLITNNGITKYEASYMRMPSLIVSQEKKANKFQKIFSKDNNSIFLGHYRNKKVKNLNKFITRLINNSSKLKKLQDIKSNFDSYGAKRILSKINFYLNQYEKKNFY